MPAFLVSHLWRRKGQKKTKTFNCDWENSALLTPGADLSCTQPEVSITSAGGHEVSQPQRWNDPSYYSALFSGLSPPNAVALIAEGRSLPSLRAICAALRRRRAGVSSRADEVIYMAPGRSLVLSANRSGAVRGLHPKRSRDSLACILSCAAHNSWGPDYFVWSARSTLSLGLIIATTHFGVRHSVRHGVTFVPFKGEMFCSPLAHLVRTEDHVFINIHEAYESSRDC